MNALQTFIRNHVLLCAGIIVFFAIRAFTYTPQNQIWDESVYVLMGKYLASSGETGFLESTRPIVWPAILGALCKRGLDPFLWGHILILFFSAGNIILVYALGRKIFDRGVGPIAAVLLALSPTSYFWGNRLLTEAPAVFFGLLSVYWVVNERYIGAGFTGVLSALTRFTQALDLLPLTVFVFLKGLEKRRLQKILPVLKYAAGAILPLAAYTIVHFGLFEDPLLPFSDARALYTRFSYDWAQETLPCLRMLLNVEGGLVLFALVNLVLSWRRLTKAQLLIWAIALLQLIWIGKYPIDPPRYFQTALPYLYLLAANGIVRGYELSKIKKHGYVYVSCVIAFVAFQGYAMFKSGFLRSDADKLQEYVTRHQGRIKGVVWISDPNTVSGTDIGVSELMYYPTFDPERIAALRAKLPKTDFILLDSGNLGCRKLDDPVCNARRDELLATIKQKFHAEFYYEKPETNDFAGVFRRQ